MLCGVRRGFPPFMRPVPLLCGAFLAALIVVSLPAATARMALDEVRAGMTGIGITVFEGETREEFSVHVLGVLANVMGPRRNLIVARLEGGPLADSGVIQGMSGSPVYIDGRLVGAVSYSLGSFSREAIAGITPIEEMAATDDEASRLASRRPPRRYSRRVGTGSHASHSSSSGTCRRSPRAQSMCRRPVSPRRRRAAWARCSARSRHRWRWAASSRRYRTFGPPHSIRPVS